MTSRQPCSAWRRRLGDLALTALLASGAALAQTGSVPAGAPSGPPQDFPYNASMPPLSPPDAVTNHEQGVVMLKVLVSTEGTARRIDIDHDSSKVSPELAKVASDAAMKWHFHPRLENGKAVEAWVSVPVFFSLSPVPPHPHGPPPSMMPPPLGAPPPPPPPPPDGGPFQPTSSNS